MAYPVAEEKIYLPSVLLRAHVIPTPGQFMNRKLQTKKIRVFRSQESFSYICEGMT